VVEGAGGTHSVGLPEPGPHDRLREQRRWLLRFL
jgi:hypothetical protein